jgi:hypothetical protein
MISGISSAYAGLSLASARFDRAMTTATAAAADDGSTDAAAAGTTAVGTTAAGSTDLAGAMVGMDVARFAFLASLQIAHASTEMVSDALKLGDYGR